MNRFVKIFAITAIFWFVLQPFTASGRDLELNAYVDKNTLTINDYFKYTVEISGSIGTMQKPELPDLSQFHILSGPSESSSYQYINGAMSASKTFTYLLQPKKIGEFVIQPVKLKVKKEVLKTEPIVIRAVKDAGQNRGKTSGQSQKSQQSQRTPDTSREFEEDPGDVFLRAEPDKTTLVQNDGVTITYKLYFRVNISTYEITKVPQTAGFWTEEFELPRQPVIGEEIIGGRKYQVAAIKKVTLFPTKYGVITIEPLEAQLQVRQKRRSNRRDPFQSFFDDPFFGTTFSVPRYVQSNPVKLNVKPLPREGKPEQFSGAAGQYQMEVTIDKDSVETNVPITLTLVIHGRGNIRTTPPPKFEIPADFEQYDPEVEVVTDKSRGYVYGSKTFRYLLVPRFPGLQEIEPIKFSFYNTRSKKYETLQSQPFKIKVSRGKETIMPGGISISPGDVKYYGSDINFIKNSTRLRPADNLAFNGAGYSMAYIIPLLLLIGGIAGRSYYLRLNPAKIRAAHAYRNAKSAVEKAVKSGDSESSELFYRNIGEGLRGYMADKLGISQAGLVLEEIMHFLKETGISEATVGELKEIISICDMGRFSTGSIAESEKNKLGERAGKVLNLMEEQWKK